MMRKDVGIDHVEDMVDASVCVQTGSTTEVVAADVSRQHKLNLQLVGVGTRTASKHTPALSTKDSYLRDEVDPAGLRSAHLASNCEAEYCWDLQGRRYSRPQGLGHRPSFAYASRRLARNHPLRPAKADLVEVEIRVMRADVVEHARDGTAHPVVEALG